MTNGLSKCCSYAAPDVVCILFPCAYAHGYKGFGALRLLALRSLRIGEARATSQSCSEEKNVFDLPDIAMFKFTSAMSYF
jgi:hypothetical protein